MRIGKELLKTVGKESEGIVLPREDDGRNRSIEVFERPAEQLSVVGCFKKVAVLVSQKRISVRRQKLNRLPERFCIGIGDGEAALNQGLFREFRGPKRVFRRVGTDGNDQMPGAVVSDGRKEFVRLSRCFFRRQERTEIGFDGTAVKEESRDGNQRKDEKTPNEGGSSKKSIRGARHCSASKRARSRGLSRGFRTTCEK